MVVSTIFAPSLLGLIDGYGAFNGIPEKSHCSVFAETDLRGGWIGHQVAVEILNEKNLWQEMAHILAQRLMVLRMRSQEMVGVDSYPMVRTLLTELADYPEEYRRQINALSFIQRRTNLSRSRVMSILAELRKGGYITVHRGVLEKITRTLPPTFKPARRRGVIFPPLVSRWAKAQPASESPAAAAQPAETPSAS